jgi:hypothetical protein
METISKISVSIMLTSILISTYFIVKTKRDALGKNEFEEDKQYIVLNSIIVLNIIVALLELIQEKYILSLIWVFSTFMYYNILKNVKERFNNMREMYKRQQEDIDLFEKKPTEFTRKKSISEQLDDMLEEYKNEN